MGHQVKMCKNCGDWIMETNGDWVCDSRYCKESVKNILTNSYNDKFSIKKTLKIT